jgi:hypothetical protein
VCLFASFVRAALDERCCFWSIFPLNRYDVSVWLFCEIYSSTGIDVGAYSTSRARQLQQRHPIITSLPIEREAPPPRVLFLVPVAFFAVVAFDAWRYVVGRFFPPSNRPTDLICLSSLSIIYYPPYFRVVNRFAYHHLHFG